MTRDEILSRYAARERDFSGADLARADLSGADLSGANLSGANLSEAKLYSANLSRADLTRANLSRADLTRANLRGANLSRADLYRADLYIADLYEADLSEANLSGAKLNRAHLSKANLSQSKGLLSASAFLASFERDEHGVLVYRAPQGSYPHPSHWRFEPGAVLEETPNPDRCTACGCGVAFATRDWVQREYMASPIWLCRIRWEWLADVVVPFGTDGKARCAKLELLRVVG